MTNSKSEFHVFHYTYNSCADWCTAIDTGLPANASDAQRGDLCCRQCQCFGLPFTFVADILTLPYRGIRHIVKKKKQAKKQKKVHPR